MNEYRNEVLDWAEQGRLRPATLSQALRASGITPSRAGWLRFFDLLTLWLGVVFCAAAVIFFFAYNWQAMGRYLRFGLVELLLAGAVAAALRIGSDRLAGKAALLLAGMLTGALLALVGQTYQTGADPWELFAVWALAILPWVALARFAAYWLFWLGLLNLAATLYYRTFGGLLGLVFTTEAMLWTLFALNLAALAAWEIAVARGIAWLDESWAVRVLSLAAGAMITLLVIWAIFERDALRLITATVYLAWAAAIYANYRHRRIDLFNLAGLVLSVIAVVTALLVKALSLGGSDAGSFLLVSMVIIGLSAAGGIWLRKIAQQARAGQRDFAAEGQA